MSKVFGLTLLTLALNFSFGQINIQWQVSFNGTGNFIDKPVDMELDASGNTYVTGSSYDGSSYNWVTIKYDSNGSPLWTSTYGGSGLDEASALVLDNSGNIVVTGYRHVGGSDYDIAVVKYNGTTGGVMWSHIFTGSTNFDTGNDVTVDNSNNIIIGGSYSFSATDMDYIVLKYPSAGTTPTWTYTNGSSNNDEGKLVLTDAAGNIFLGGHSHQGASFIDFMLLKFGPGGGAPTNSGYTDSGFNNLDTPHSMAFDGAGNVILAGQGFTTIQDEEDYMLVKYNSNCVFQWRQLYAGNAEQLDRINAIVVDQTTNAIYVTGKSKTIASSEDYYTIAYNSAGVEQWSQTYTTAGLGFDEATDISLSSSGYVYVTGISNGGASGNDFLTVKYDASNGNYQWETRFNGPSSLADNAVRMQLDASENIFITGSSHGGATNLDYRTIKYCQLTTVASNDTSLCVGQSVDLSVSGGSSPTWAVLSGDMGSLSCTNCATTTADPNTTSVYTVSTQSASGCIDYDTVTVTVNSIPVPTIYFDTPTTFCSGGSVILYTDSYASYLWNTTAVDSFITVTSGGTYDVTITDINGCQANASQVVTVNSLPPVNAGTDQTICPGETTTLGASGAVSYLWTYHSSLSSTTIPNPDATPTTPITYTVTGTDGNGCQNSDQVQIFFHTPVQVNAGLDDNICLNDSLQLSASGVVSYQWTANPSFLTATNIPNPWVQPLVQTEYFVTGTDGNGCETIDSVTISLIALPGVSAGPDATICLGESHQFFATGGLTYVWNANPSLSNINISNPWATPTAQTTYVVFGTDVNTCTNSDTVTLFVNPLPNVSAGVDFAVCPGGTAQFNATGALSYVWDADPSFITAMNIPNPQALPTSANTYTVTGTDVNGCENSDNVLVTIHPPAVIDAGPDLQLCVGDSVQLNATGGDSYVWNFNVTLSDFIIADPWANPTVDNQYIVTGTDSNNCTDKDTVWVFVNPLPTAPVITKDSIWLISNQPTGNQWYFNGSPVPGATNDTLDWLAQGVNGSYTLSYTDANGCTSFSLVTNIIIIDDIGIGENESFDVSIYPNPTSGFLNVAIDENVDQLIVYNLSGEVILVQTNLQAGVNEIDLYELTDGMYLIQLIKDDQSVIKRIVKQ